MGFNATYAYDAITIKVPGEVVARRYAERLSDDPRNGDPATGRDRHFCIHRRFLH